MTFINYLNDYAITFKKSAEKELAKLPTSLSKEIEKKLFELVHGAQNLNVKKLIGYHYDTYRLRIGNYRVLFEIYKHEIRILVVSIKHRKEVYE